MQGYVSDNSGAVVSESAAVSDDTDDCVTSGTFGCVRIS